MSTNREAALGYAEMGLAIFPLKPGGKVPLISKDDGGRGVHDATSDLTQIEAWWSRWPDANMGLACGAGFWVLDVDYAGWTTTEPDGADSLVYLADHFGRLPRTIRQYTGGMGWQYLWAPDPRVRNGVSILPGLDTRAAGGYVVVPPSLHPSGRHYRWIEVPGEVPLAPAPEWLVELLAPAPEPLTPQPPPRIDDLSRYATAALESACRTIEQAAPGTQNATLNSELSRSVSSSGGGVIPRGDARGRWWRPAPA